MAWFVLLATLLGLALRLNDAAASLSFDEGATLYFARLPWSELLGAPARLKPNPPLFYAVEHLLRGVLGETELALRLPSIVAGALCTPVAAFIARRAAGPAAAAIAAILVATSAVGVVSSQDARAYSMLTLALLLAVAALLVAMAAHRKARRPETGAAWAVFVLAGTAALYLHHTAVLLLLALDFAALLAWAIALGAPRRVFWQLVAANLVVALLYLPWLPVTLGQVGGIASNDWMTVPSLAGLRYAVMNVMAQPYATGLQPWADAAFLALGTLGVLLLRRDRLLLGIAVFLLAGVPAASWGISQLRPIMNGKTLLPLAPLFLVFVAAGCARLGRLRVPVAAALVAVQLWACRGFFADRPDEAFPAVAAALRDRAEPGDALVLAQPELAILLDYYGWPRDRLRVAAIPAPGTWFRGWPDTPLPVNPTRLWLLSRTQRTRQAALAALADPGRAVLNDETFGRGRMRNLELTLFGQAPGE